MSAYRPGFTVSPKFVFSLCCSISNQLWEPPNEREETRTPMTAFDTNDVILTNHTQDTMMTFLARRNIFSGQGIRETCFFTAGRVAGEVSFAAAFILRGLMTVVCSMGTEDRYVNFRRRLHRFFTVKTNEITRKHLILCSSVSDKWQKTLKTPKNVGRPVGKEGVLCGVNRL